LIGEKTMSYLADSGNEEIDKNNKNGDDDNDDSNSSTDEESDADPEQILRDGIAWAKKEFEEERDQILNSIPESYKSMFGQIGFVNWGKLPYPVLILNPYNIPPGPVRNQWISMFKKVRAFLTDFCCYAYISTCIFWTFSYDT
jgi:hypothetical protein